MKSIFSKIFRSSKKKQESISLTILFADIVGSTSLYEILGDSLARAIVTGCLSRLSDSTLKNNGTVIKTLGDGIMSTFLCPSDAVDAAVDMHDEINATWTDLIVRKRSFPSSIKLTDKSKELFFMVSYNIDQFKRFVFESAFLERFDVDEKTIEEIKHDEIGLLKFGLIWLKDILFKDKQLDGFKK